MLPNSPCRVLACTPPGRWADERELREAHHPTAVDSAAVAEALARSHSPEYERKDEVEREVGAGLDETWAAASPSGWRQGW